MEKTKEPIVITIVKGSRNEAEWDDGVLKKATEVLMSGEQSYDSFRHIAEHFTDYIDEPDQIHPQAIKWISLALGKIASGDNPEQALGIKKKVGRARQDFILASRAGAHMELCKREKMNKTQAIQKTAEMLHKDSRHIQRVLAIFRLEDISGLPDHIVREIAARGIGIRNLSGDLEIEHIELNVT
jgi:hypothetical protein